MTIDRTISIDGTDYPLVLSDEPKTLLAAKAAGRVVVGIGAAAQSYFAASDPGVSEPDISDAGTKDTSDWLPANFIAESLPVDEAWLEGAVRRELGIPWKIGETDRLIIREFSLDDCARIPDDADDSPDEAILKDPLQLKKYMDEQYAFFDCGMWAVVRKEDSGIIGMVSLTPASFSDADGAEEKVCELGYHIYAPYRRRGYAKEACRCILDLLSEREISVIARAEPQNTASVALLKSLGFEQRSSDCFLRLYFV